jgi:hypothetical protein
VWAAIAIPLFLAVFRGNLPAPGDLPAPVGIILFIAYVPFLMGAQLLAVVGRGSASIAEITVVAVICGMAIGAAAGSLITLVVRMRQHKIPTPAAPSV